jgi:hypothetical protein
MNTMLYEAAQEARFAPSILNTQPWRWRLHGDVLDLHIDPDRRLRHLDPHGHLLILSCGAALHHARIAIAAAGFCPVIDRFPDPERPELLARICHCREQPATDDCLRVYRSIRLRHTDRRPFAPGARIPAAALARLRAAAEAERARLHVIARSDIIYLRYAAQGAHTVGARDTAATAELRRWTHRGADAAAADRTVPLRDFGLGDEATPLAGHGDDDGAEYLVIATDRDEPMDWLTAGEAASAVWLATTTHGLAASPMSDVVEIPGARMLVRSLLHPRGHPHLVLRTGVAQEPGIPVVSPRRAAGDVAGGQRPWSRDVAAGVLLHTARAPESPTR